MSSVSNDIKTASKIIETNPAWVDRFSKIYPFATENVPGVFSNYDFKDKDCLTVLGSSAQLIYMYLNGAKKVTSFDINGLTVYYFYFIKAFLLSGLNKEDLMILFLGNKENVDKIFNIIKKYLFNDAYTFWNSLYEKYGAKLFNDFRLFNNLENKKIDNIYRYCGFLDGDIAIVRSIIEKVEPNFINCNIKDLGDFLNEHYDVIYLSNIIGYVDSYEMYGCFNGNIYPLEEFKKLLIKLSSFLNPFGILYAGYIYDPKNAVASTPIMDESCRNLVFPTDEFSYHYFDGYETNDMQSDTKDACLILRR